VGKTMKNANLPDTQYMALLALLAFLPTQERQGCQGRQSQMDQGSGALAPSRHFDSVSEKEKAEKRIRKTKEGPSARSGRVEGVVPNPGHRGKEKKRPNFGLSPEKRASELDGEGRSRDDEGQEQGVDAADQGLNKEGP